MPMIIQILCAWLTFVGYLGLGLMVILAMDANPRFVVDTEKVRDSNVARIWLVWPLFVLWLLWRASRRG